MIHSYKRNKSSLFFLFLRAGYGFFAVFLDPALDIVLIFIDDAVDELQQVFITPGDGYRSGTLHIEINAQVCQIWIHHQVLLDDNAMSGDGVHFPIFQFNEGIRQFIEDHHFEIRYLLMGELFLEGRFPGTAGPAPEIFEWLVLVRITDEKNPQRIPIEFGEIHRFLPLVQRMDAGNGDIKFPITTERKERGETHVPHLQLHAELISALPDKNDTDANHLFPRFNVSTNS